MRHWLDWLEKWKREEKKVRLLKGNHNKVIVKHSKQLSFHFSAGDMVKSNVSDVKASTYSKRNLSLLLNSWTVFWSLYPLTVFAYSITILHLFKWLVLYFLWVAVCYYINSRVLLYLRVCYCCTCLWLKYKALTYHLQRRNYKAFLTTTNMLLKKKNINMLDRAKVGLAE